MGAPLSGDTKHNAEGACHLCGGQGHKKQNCFNHVAANDVDWGRMSDPTKKRRCKVCGGVGHWNAHHTGTLADKRKAAPTSGGEKGAAGGGPGGGGKGSAIQPDAAETSKTDCRFWLLG